MSYVTEENVTKNKMEALQPFNKDDRHRFGLDTVVIFFLRLSVRCWR